MKVKKSLLMKVLVLTIAIGMVIGNTAPFLCTSYAMGEEAAQPAEETKEVAPAQASSNRDATKAGDTREDWLHYSIDLYWDIADETQKYNQKVVTASSAILQPTYTLTIQTSSVNYEKEKMEIRLPYYMFTKRTTSKSQDGTPAVYDPPKLAPAMIPVPEYPAEATGDKFFSYYFDEETEELVFINTQYIPAGSNQTIQVKYDVLPEFVVDLDKATFQAKGKATPQDEETGSYVEEKKESPIITYQLDTGLSNMSGNQTCTKNTGFEPLKIEDGYRYYKASYRKTVSGNQPFYKTPTFVLNNGGEILGPVENYNSKTVMTLDEASAYFSEEAFVDAKGGGSNSEGAIFDPAEYFDVYVRYPDTGEEVEDRMRITCDVVAWDDDTHQEPEDMNDLLSSYTDYYYTWTKNPIKPRGIWYKNPINQDRGRVEFLVSKPISETGVTYPHGPALFRIGVEDNHTIYLDQGNVGKLVITDTGLKQETIVDGINGIAEPNDSPYLNYEICGVYLPVLLEDAIKIFNEETESIEAYDGDWFDEILIEGSKDGETWEEVYRTTDKHDERLSYSPRYLTHDYFFDLDTLEAWTGKGYRQSRVSILGIKENIVISDDIVHVYMHGLDTTEDYVLREALDKYTNWVDIDIYDDQDQSKYSVKDWGMLTLYPMAETGKADIIKNTRSVELDTPNEEVHVEFSVRSTRSYSFVDTVPNPGEEIGKLMYQIKQQVPEAFQNTKDYDDIETLVTYDLLPEGYVFDKFTGNTTFSNSGAYINFSGDGTMWAQFIQPKITTIDNYKGTNRQMVIFEWDVKDQTQAVLNNECSVHGISLDFKYIATIKVEDLVFYQNGHNLVAEQRGDGKEFFGGQEDDGDPTGKSYQNMSVFTDVVDENGDYAYKDVNDDGITDKKDTIYTYSTVSPNVPLSAATGISKQIKGDSLKWTDIDHTDINKDYYYRVRVSNGFTTHITDLIIYDTLEEAANTELHSGEVTWKGSFKSIDVHQMVSQGFDPVVYYSTADPSDLDYNLVTGREDNIWIDDTNIWSTTCPDNPSEVTAVAVDVRKMADGTDAILDQYEGVEFIITMQAPPEYPTLSDPDMVYAINRPAYHSYQYVDYAADGEYFTDIGRRVKIYLEPYGKITVRKTSEGRDTPENTEFLLEGPHGYSKTFKYSDMTDGEMVIEDLRIGEYTITEKMPWGNDNKWSVTFDGAANAREVGPRENAADVELTWDDLEAEVDIHNKSIVKALEGTKTWQERQDITDAKYTIESDWLDREYPSSRKRANIFIYADGEYFGQAFLYEYETSWAYGDVPIKNDEGQEIEYTFEEMVYAPVRFDYIDDGGNSKYDIKTLENTLLEENKDIELVLVRTSNKWPEPDIVEIYDTKTVNTDIFDTETVLWSGLPSYNSSEGHSYYYNVYVRMKDVGYLEINEGNDISNIRLMSVEAVKQWQVPEGSDTPEVTLYLEKTVNGKTSEVDGSDKIIPANATGDDLKATWEDLPEYEDGYPVTYTVAERLTIKSQVGNDINR